MVIQKSPNGWSCLLTSFAMVLDEPYKKLIDDLGHDGSQIVWPNLSEPYNRRSFHPQELIDLCFNRGYHVITIERLPLSIPTTNSKNDPFTPITNYHYRYLKYLSCYNGVLVGETHAVAWDGFRVFDPKGHISSSFDSNLFFAIIK